MTYEEALGFIHGAKYNGSKDGLKNITTLMDKLGNQQDSLRFVHIAGTNGKGSTAAFISSVLVQAGYTTGLFTSPYLERFTERFQVNGEEISETELAEVTELVKEKVSEMVLEGDQSPSEFEIVTAIGFIYFKRKKCDIVVLETGLGGRFDSTNIVRSPEAVVITAIDYDHMQYLGDTIEQIAFEKAGIIKPGSNVILYDADSNIKNVFIKKCGETKSTLYPVDFNCINSVKSSELGQEFSFGQHNGIKIRILGMHQVKNASTAIKTCEILQKAGYNISETALKEGLAKAFWKGRLEVVNDKPVVILDGAHNIQGVKALHDFVREYFKEKKVVGVAGILLDKEYKEMIKIMSSVCNSFILPRFSNDRAADPEILAKTTSEYGREAEICGSIDDFLDKYIIRSEESTCKNATLNDQVYIVYGSLYFIGDLRKKIYERKSLNERKK